MPRLARGSGTLAVATAQTLVPVAVRPPRPRSAVQAGDRRRSAGGPCLPSSLESCDINILPFATQVKHLPLSPSHDHPLKLKVTFCVRGVISPCLANVYLHDALDTWFEKHVKPRLQGRCFMIRFADDAVMVFSEERDARRTLDVLPQRLGQYGLTLHPTKTRLLHFRSPLAGSDQPRGTGKQSFDFLGFTHHWARSRRGSWVVKRKTASSRFSRALKRASEWFRKVRHQPVAWQHEQLVRKLRGHDNYY